MVAGIRLMNEIDPGKHGLPGGFACRIAAEVKNFDPLNFIEKKEVKKMGRFIHLAMAAAEEAMCMSGLQIPPETVTLAAITIVGGAYNEVRRIFAALGSHVLGLCRVRFGAVELPRDLSPGEYRLLPAGAHS